MRYIDLTPTWTAVLPMLIAVLENGNDTGRKAAREELQRMATAADAYNAMAKSLSTDEVEGS